MLENEVVIALSGLLGTAIASYYGYLKIVAEHRKSDQLKRELDFQQASLDFGSFMHEWGGTLKEIEKLLEETSIDRFLILRGWNGMLDPRWTTAVFQLREGEQQCFSYIHFELDNDYVARLHEIGHTGIKHYTVSEMPENAAIKSVYETEGVVEAVWSHIETKEIPGTKSRAITYCSFATHTGPITEADVTRCRILSGRLKGVALAFDSRT